MNVPNFGDRTKEVEQNRVDRFIKDLVDSDDRFSDFPPHPLILRRHLTVYFICRDVIYPIPYTIDNTALISLAVVTKVSLDVRLDTADKIISALKKYIQIVEQHD